MKSSDLPKVTQQVNKSGWASESNTGKCISQSSLCRLCAIDPPPVSGCEEAPSPHPALGSPLLRLLLTSPGSGSKFS